MPKEPFTKIELQLFDLLPTNGKIKTNDLVKALYPYEGDVTNPRVCMLYVFGRLQDKLIRYGCPWVALKTDLAPGHGYRQQAEYWKEPRTVAYDANAEATRLANSSPKLYGVTRKPAPISRQRRLELLQSRSWLRILAFIENNRLKTDVILVPVHGGKLQLARVEGNKILITWVD